MDFQRFQQSVGTLTAVNARSSHSTRCTGGGGGWWSFPTILTTSCWQSAGEQWEVWKEYPAPLACSWIPEKGEGVFH